MTPDELKSIPKGQFIVMKTGTHPMRTRLRLFLEWGITFGEPYVLPEKAARPVSYASKQELEQAILRKHPPMDIQPDEAPAPQPGPADPPKGADLDRARKELGLLRPVSRHLKNMEDSEVDGP